MTSQNIDLSSCDTLYRRGKNRRLGFGGSAIYNTRILENKRPKNKFKYSMNAV
jgi:hypothetical protein